MRKEGETTKGEMMERSHLGNSEILMVSVFSKKKLDKCSAITVIKENNNLEVFLLLLKLKSNLRYVIVLASYHSNDINR